MTIEEKIEAALVARMRDIVLTPALPIGWPNRPLTPPTPEAYLRVDHLRNANQRLLVKGSAPHRRMGILQVTVVTPLNQGWEPATQIAGAVAEHFPADLDLFEDGVRVRIQDAPSVGTATPEDASWNCVLSVRYESFC